MKENVNFYGQKEFQILVSQVYPNLLGYKKTGDRTAFNDQLLKMLPKVKQYIASRLNAAIQKGHFPKGKYKPNDFVDQLFISVYEHIEEVDNENELYTFLFKMADELLEETIVDEEFDTLFLENIDNYSKPEWDEMEEKFSTDGDGDTVMIEELDDFSYRKNDYTLNHVFIEDNEEAGVAKLDEALSAERVRNHINLVLHSLPFPMRNVFELFNDQQFTLSEIAAIKKTTVTEVEQLLADARDILRRSFSKRFLLDSN
tara:strand:+ start:1211 stop:1984 length:774 start_codon:yes stop_codon:yes gene_type:complete